MDNERISSDKTEEEYHFDDATHTSSPGLSAVGDGYRENIKNKNLLIAVIVLVVGFGLYWLLNVFFVSSKTHNGSHAKKPQPAATSIALSQPAMSMPSTQQLPAAKRPVDLANERLSDIELKNSANHELLEKLSAQLGDVQVSLSNLDNKLTNLQNAIQQEVAQRQSLAAESRAKKRKARVVRRSFPKPVYYVRAMIPGRAWLTTQDKSTITVSVGDNVPGYGVVEMIDPDQGTVMMSSGAIVGYSPNDS